MSFRIATSDGVAELVIPAQVPETRLPTDAELALIRERIDPEGLANKEVRA